MIRVTKKDDPRDHSAGCANPGPNGIGRTYGDGLHGLRNRKKAQHNENHCDDARDQFAKPLAIFQRNRKANLKEPCQQKKNPR